MPPNEFFPRPEDLGLKFGDRGEGVARLNRYLQRFGYLPLDLNPIDEFDQPTLLAVQTFGQELQLGGGGEITPELMSAWNRARCGPPRPRPSAPVEAGEHNTIHGNPWKKSRITYRVIGSPDGFTPTEAIAAIEEAFSWWKRAMLALEFVGEHTATADVDIEIGFFRDESHDPNDYYPFSEYLPDGSRVLAHAYFPLVGSGKLAGDIHFSKYISWKKKSDPTFNERIDYDLTSVAAHEIGHALGLDHVEDPDSVMFPIYFNRPDGVSTLEGEILDALYKGEISVVVADIGLEGSGGPPTRMIVASHVLK